MLSKGSLVINFYRGGWWTYCNLELGGYQEILTDLNNKVAKSFGIVFALEDELKEIYKGFGIDLNKTQGNKNYELPVPATYVVDQNGTIILAHVEIDYTTRMEPEDVLMVL